MGYRSTDLGDAAYIRISRPDGKPMPWSEVYQTYSDTFPTSWAVQCFPPIDQVLDEANIYHLFVLETPPRGMNIARR